MIFSHNGFLSVIITCHHSHTQMFISAEFYLFLEAKVILHHPVVFRNINISCSFHVDWVLYFHNENYNDNSKHIISNNHKWKYCNIHNQNTNNNHQIEVYTRLSYSYRSTEWNFHSHTSLKLYDIHSSFVWIFQWWSGLDEQKFSLFQRSVKTRLW